MALLPELDVKSVLDVVEENFQRLGLKTFAIRMIYAGEHTLRKEELISQFENSIKNVNADYCDITVNGLLLVYDSYFVHVVEGSEDTVHKQLRILMKQEENWIRNRKTQEQDLHNTETVERNRESQESKGDEPGKEANKMFRRLKMLMVYHSIQTFLFAGWRAVTAHPPALISKLDVYGPLSEHMEQLRICLDKMRRLCSLLKANEMISFESLSALDFKMETLPEAGLLDFLLQSQHIVDLRQVIYLHRRVDDYYFYFENVWPLPTHFTPRQLYKLKIDSSFVEPLPVMPWELVKKEDVEDEEKEQSSSSSD